jgi:hypothetical protein
MSGIWPAIAACVALQGEGEPVYYLPWEEGKTWSCMQGNRGRRTHQDIDAVDFDMPEGTPVCAARAGKVTYVKEDSNEGGADRAKYYSKANQIEIDHGDGTKAAYAHLKKDGALVSVGDFVVAGEVIGLSGKTGWATAPHLHFEVVKGGNTVVIRFAEIESDGGVPKEGKRYSSKNRPQMPKDEKDRLFRLAREAAEAYRYGAFFLAYPRWKQLAEARPPVPLPPCSGAAQEIADMERRGRHAVDEVRQWAANGELESAIEKSILLRRMYAGTTVEAALAELDAELKKDPIYEGVTRRTAPAEKLQGQFFEGLARELEGKTAEAAECYRKAVEGKGHFADWARERMKGLESR